MKDVTGLISIALAVLAVGAGGIEPNNGYCIGNQCFAVLQHRGNFATALNQCRELNGHLMTVRSSVAHDSLLILLENLAGRYWIGLRLPSACPDPTVELRGFQWVTKDTESDFYNWASTFDASCASPKCVSLSKDNDFKWIQEPCDAQTDGFLCEYNFQNPCSRLRAAGGESVTYIIPYGFRGEDVASPPPGSIATFTPSGNKSICSSEQWHPAPWTCEIEEGGCEHQCAEDPRHGPSCFCPPGKAVNPANNITCGADGDDPCASLRCQFTCSRRDDGSLACICDHGFQLAGDGRSCVDFDECMEERQCPQENHKCVNTVGDFQCVCEDGYAQSGDLCVDVNECVSAPCEHLCDNTPGSYKCACFEGYIAIPETPEKCKLHCGREECVAECDPNDEYQCYCPDGYILDEREDSMVCVDMDECQMIGCDQDCKNTFGSFVCLCFPGYTLEEDTCVKDEEGSGAGTTPRMVSKHTVPPPVPPPVPTTQPSQVSPGALAAIILCVVVVILVLVYLLSRFLRSRGKPETPGEAHDLEEKQPHTDT
ncbi:thrombomodulin [Genypterus blacodes]|uniref:thrombomodulin n=1 Tax=Genypterus blacodes TaxID=154954 RepID=UPI003F775BB2